MIRLITILSFFIPINLLAQQKLQFIGERIDFAINKERFSINGIYYFLNNTEVAIRQNILFPFPKEADSLIVKRIYNLTYSEKLSFQQLNNAVAFKIVVLPKDTVKVNIAYSQNTDKENIYILESTQTWGKALKRADYSLTIDTSVQIDSLSLKPDSLINNIYYWDIQDFYPNNNFRVWIK
ncbi:MAG: hypothetical protein VB110_09005 [Bacteroidales bacterium]|nr:hypothetical protein [Bacteroidales bacterium]